MRGVSARRGQRAPFPSRPTAIRPDWIHRPQVRHRPVACQASTAYRRCTALHVHAVDHVVDEKDRVVRLERVLHKRRHGDHEALLLPYLPNGVRRPVLHDDADVEPCELLLGHVLDDEGPVSVGRDDRASEELVAEG